MWRSCRVQPSHKEQAIGAVRCKKEGMLLQPLGWRCVWYNDSLQTGCSRRNAPMCMWRIQTINEPSHRVLLLATVVRSFGLLPLGLSDVHSHIFCSKHSFAKILVGLSNFKYHKNGTIPNVTNTRISCSVAGATAQRYTNVFITHCASRFLSILWNLIFGSWKRLKHL